MTSDDHVHNKSPIHIIEGAPRGNNDRIFLVIDDHRYGGDDRLIFNKLSGKYRIVCYDQSIGNLMFMKNISDLSAEIIKLSTIPTLHLLENEGEISQGWGMYRQDSGETYLLLSFFYDVESWRRLWSIKEYDQEFRRIFEKQDLQNVKWLMNEAVDFDVSLAVPNRISLMFRVSDTNTTFEAEAKKHSDDLNRLHNLTVQSLTSKLRGDSVVVQFDFPEEVKVACEQYLLYFVQFLKDIGLEATAELQHEAGQVLFAVTPTNKEEALDKIRDALGTYLKLAASPVDVSSALSSDIQVQRLSANIQHLQGQLTLAHAILQSKDATIQLQQANIEMQRRALGGEVLIDSMKDVTPKPKDAEEVLGGLAEITKYEGKGFNLNLPEAFRRLRELFSDKKGGKK